MHAFSVLVFEIEDGIKFIVLGYRFKVAEGLSPNTVIKHHAIIRSALQWALKHQYIRYNPADLATRPSKIHYQANEPYSVEEIVQLLTLTQSEPIAVPIFLASFYGLRRSEVLGLRWSNIDFQNGWIHISTDSKSTHQKKFTVFSMYEHFREHTRHALIDGSFHIYHEIEKCYKPFDQKQLESYLLNQYYKEISQTGSLRIVKTCAELIMRKAALEVSSADKSMQLCFKSGYIPLSDINRATLTPYWANDPPSSGVFSTYTINATPVPEAGIL